MGAKINTYTVDGWRGTVPALANTVTARDRAGTDGYTFVRAGKRSPPFTISTRETCSTISSARNRCADYEALINKFVILEDPSGRGYSRVMVLNVVPEARRLLVSTDGNAAVVSAEWSLQRG